MRNAALLAAGLGCLGLAAALAVAAGPRDRAARPASLGAPRTLLVDVLFLRAEALRAEGRLDEVPGLYRRILDLDPDNEAAVDFLAHVEAHDLRSAAPTPEARVRWWLAARDLVAAALAHHPDSARLHFRAAELLRAVPALDPAVASHLAASGTDAPAEALAHLDRAARLAPSLSHHGYLHLDRFARLAPLLAAERLARGAPGVDEALATGDAVLSLRAAQLDDFYLDPDDALSAYRRLQAALNLVREVRRRLEATPPDRARALALLDAYARLVGEDPVARALRPLVR